MDNSIIITEEHLIYLDTLRNSGQINMYNTSPSLQNEFGLSKHEAREILSYWMRNFDKRHPELL